MYKFENFEEHSLQENIFCVNSLVLISKKVRLGTDMRGLSLTHNKNVYIPKQSNRMRRAIRVRVPGWKASEIKLFERFYFQRRTALPLDRFSQIWCRIQVTK